MEYDSDDNCVTFIWKIYDFSHCTQKTGECLTSPEFLINNWKFTISLYPGGTRDMPDSIGFRLWKGTDIYDVKLTFVFSISTGTGSFENSMVSSHSFTSFPHYLIHTSVLFLTVPSIHKRKIMRNASDDDTLTVKCKIVKVDDVPIDYIKNMNAYTVIDVKKTTYSWNINTFIHSTEKKCGTKELNLYENTSFTIDISWVNSNQDLFAVLIRRTKENERHFSNCTLSLLDKEKVLQSVRHEHWFENKQGIEHVWNIPFAPRRQLRSYPQHNTYFILEFGVSKGIETSGINKIEHGLLIEHQFLLNHTATCTKPPTESSKSFKDNLQRFYADGTLSDVTIRTPTKEFPVHKALLCAQSEVFTAMFERNMKEKETGIIDIDDSKDETISKMLLYIYGGIVENLDWESALNLYSAAHKYRIAALCEQCSDFLKENLSTQNFYECLHLADLHQDPLLKSVAQEFVMRHSTEVINSEEWTEFMEVNLSLAAETMRTYFRNLQIT